MSDNNSYPPQPPTWGLFFWNEFSKLPILGVDKPKRFGYNLTIGQDKNTTTGDNEMTIHIRTRKENKMQLNGNILTGDTYPVKDYIKSRLGGKWNSTDKSWTVDLSLVERWLDKGGTIYTDKDAQPEVSKSTAWTYEHFRRSADDPNSDY